jgi:spore germination protein KC
VLAIAAQSNASLEILSSRTETKPVFRNGRLGMDVRVKVSSEIAEINGTMDYISPPGRKQLESIAEELVRLQLEEVVKKAQVEFKSDILGFGDVVKRSIPEYWKSIKKDWETVFTELGVNISVDIEITGSALKSKPLKIGG